MTRDEAVEHILAELNRAEMRFPWWPTSAVEAASIVSEEAGELIHAANEYHWFGGPKPAMATEAIQLTAMALRFLLHWAEYTPTEAP